MPRVKILRAEIGTSGVFEDFRVTGNTAEDISRAVELEHACEDAHCDIRAALVAGCPYSAAHLLTGATETPLLDSVLSFYGIDTGDNPEDWTEWYAYHSEHGRECQSCGSFTYAEDFEPDTCGNCLAQFPPRPDSESDAFISEPASGSLTVTIEGTFEGTFEDFDSAARFLWHWTKEHGFYPETWHVNERGNTSLLARSDNPAEPYTWTEVSYV